jgi:hypothetical protein
MNDREATEMTTQTAHQLAREIAERTTDAYSFDLSYSMTAWRGVTKFLLEQGYSAGAVECILRSKHTRWADDMQGRGLDGHRMTRARFERYFATARRHIDAMLRDERVA